MTNGPGDIPPKPPPPAGPPPGWYADANSPGMQRWWDGYRWTEHQVPIAPPAPAVQQSVAGFNTRMYSSEADRAAGTNTAAVWALIVGCVGIVVVIFPGTLAALLGIAALVWGMVGTTRAAASGVGTGMAIAGLVFVTRSTATKVFTYEGGVLKYELTAMGVTMTVEMIRH